METPPASRNIEDRRTSTALRWLCGTFAALTMFVTGWTVRPSAPAEDPDADLVALTSAALDRAQEFWASQIGSVWRDARVVLIDVTTGTPCGPADKRSGPFYCPFDHKVYLDLSFLRAIDGGLARAYVVAHEIGHHVQDVIGDVPNATSIVIELEADCFAGTWMRDEMLRGHLSSVDIQSALNEAASIGDDRICPTCSREQWTHGSSAQRVEAVSRGLNGGACR